MLTEGGVGSSGAGVSGAGTVLAVAGAAFSAIGAYYAAKNQQYLLRSQALDADYAGSVATLDARLAETDAAYTLLAGHRQLGAVGARYAQSKAAQKASFGARGIQAGVGSAAETQATTELARQLDELTVMQNATRASQAQLGRAVDLRNRAALAGVSANNLRRSASSISPWVAAGGSLIGASGQFSGAFGS